MVMSLPQRTANSFCKPACRLPLIIVALATCLIHVEVKLYITNFNEIKSNGY